VLAERNDRSGVTSNLRFDRDIQQLAPVPSDRIVTASSLLSDFLVDIKTPMPNSPRPSVIICM